MLINRTTTRAGLAGGVGTAGWTMFEYFMGWHGPRSEIGAVTGFVALLFPLGALIWALRATRREHGGQLTLRDALYCGLAVSLLLAGIGVAFYLLYYTVINPAFIPQLRASGVQTDLASQLATVAVGSLGFGAVVSLVAGLLMRTRAPQGTR